MQFATIAQYYAALGKVMPDPVPDDEVARITALLTEASDDIVEMAKTGTWAHAGDGTPTDAGQLDARARATARQAVYLENNPDLRTETVREFDNIRAGSFSLTKNNAAGGSTSASGTKSRYSPRAFGILTAAGMTSPIAGTSAGY